MNAAVAQTFRSAEVKVLQAATRIGPYEIVGAIGAGGMGEVYRARDTKLNRDVAIKVLPDLFAGDADRLARFRREAQTLAALHHPRIATIFGLEDSDAVHALVMEFVDGPTLADRIAAGPVAVPDALQIAQQIAEALEYAHEHGIVHRDLKPANIKVTPEGSVKLLDFGLAKALDTSPAAASVANSPTLSVAATQAGVILGTAAYMAPEQARGRAVDKRADIWAFGCVLYEMLTGRRPFDGEDVAETLGAVIHKEPTWSALPAGTPPAVRALLQRCLQKDPKQRMRDIGDVRIQIDEAIRAPTVMEAVTPAETASPRSRIAAAGWPVAALLALVASALAFVHFRELAPAPAQPVRFQILPPEKARFTNSQPVISPDGRRIAMQVRGADGRTLIWVHSLESLDARPLAGTEGPASTALGPMMFWSPDSRYIAYGAGDGTLKKVDASGGPPQTICDIRALGTFRGGAWSPDGVIVFGILGAGLLQVPAGGGTPSPLTTLGPAEQVHGVPTFLPDGRHFLYLRASFAPVSFTTAVNASIYIGSLDLEPDRQPSKPILSAQSGALYVRSSDPAGGYLLFVREATLMVQPFDAERLELAGEIAPVAENILTAGVSPVSVSNTGILVFRSAREAESSQLTWFDSQGKPLGQVGPPAIYGNVDISPDGKTLVVDQADPQTRASHIWTVDVSRGVFSRLNPGSAADTAAAVSPDGRIAFTLIAAGAQGDIYLRLASGAGDAEPLFKSPTVKHPNDWSRDGRFLIYDDHHPTQQQDLWILPMSGEHKPIPFLVTPADEAAAHFSPDGKWIAYGSNESGRREVYVRDFAPDRVPAIGSGKWQISTAGGDKPRWRPDGREIYYLANRTMMAVPVKTTPAFEPGRAVPLFETNATGFFPYDVAADGRFLINTIADPATFPSSPITVVLNWQAGLRK